MLRSMLPIIYITSIKKNLSSRKKNECAKSIYLLRMMIKLITTNNHVNIHHIIFFNFSLQITLFFIISSFFFAFASKKLYFSYYISYMQNICNRKHVIFESYTHTHTHLRILAHLQLFFHHI